MSNEATGEDVAKVEIPGPMDKSNKGYDPHTFVDREIFDDMAADEAKEDPGMEGNTGAPDDVDVSAIKKEYESESTHRLEHVDEAKWEEAKQKSIKEYGKVNWAFVNFLYQKLVK
jgi:hypothetical protein